MIILVIYDTAEEIVYETQVQGSLGLNTITWDARNQQGQVLANGLYIYYVQAGDSGSGEKATGKIRVKR
jgi:hypothetical protein